MTLFIGNTVVQENGQLVFERYINNVSANIKSTETVVSISANSLNNIQYSFTAGHGLYATTHNDPPSLKLYNTHTDELVIDAYSNSTTVVDWMADTTNRIDNDFGEGGTLGICNGRVYGGSFNTDGVVKTSPYGTPTGAVWSFTLDGRLTSTDNAAGTATPNYLKANSAVLEPDDVQGQRNLGYRISGNCNVLVASALSWGTFVYPGRYDQRGSGANIRLMPTDLNGNSSVLQESQPIGYGNFGHAGYGDGVLQVGHNRIYTANDDHIFIHDFSGGLINAVETFGNSNYGSTNINYYWNNKAGDGSNIRGFKQIACNRDFFAIGLPAFRTATSVRGDARLFDCDGHYIADITPSQSGWATDDLYGASVAMSDEYVFVTRQSDDAANNEIYVWDMQGNAVDNFAVYTTGMTTTYRTIDSICFSDDTLYVAMKPSNYATVGEFIIKYKLPKTANSYWNHVLDLTGAM
jgi:hypothetical protein